VFFFEKAMGAFLKPSENGGVKRAERNAATLIPPFSDGTLCAAIAERMSVIANSQREKHASSRCTVWVGPFQVAEMGQK
jgi:hypothetical protein